MMRLKARWSEMLALTTMLLLSVNAGARPIGVVIDKPAMSANETEDDRADIEYKGHTYSNVLRHPSVEYFVELKKLFKSGFDPKPSLMRYFRTQSTSQNSMSAVIGVGIDGKGKLIEAFVLKSSGIRGFDKEAIRSIRSPSILPAPPDELLGEKSTLRMLWTFTVIIK